MLIEELEQESQVKVLQDLDIIACTVTGASKYKSILNSIESKIFMIEEAGQINEALLVTAMSQHTN
jgi:hypothetical protein